MNIDYVKTPFTNNPSMTRLEGPVYNKNPEKIATGPANPSRNVHKIENIKNIRINIYEFSSLKINNAWLFFLI